VIEFTHEFIGPLDTHGACFQETADTASTGNPKAKAILFSKRFLKKEKKGQIGPNPIKNK